MLDEETTVPVLQACVLDWEEAVWWIARGEDCEDELDNDIWARDTLQEHLLAWAPLPVPSLLAPRIEWADARFRLVTYGSNRLRRDHDGSPGWMDWLDRYYAIPMSSDLHPERRPDLADLEVALRGWEASLDDIDSGADKSDPRRWNLGCYPTVTTLLKAWYPDGLPPSLQGRLDQVTRRIMILVANRGTGQLGRWRGKSFADLMDDAARRVAPR